MIFRVICEDCGLEFCKYNLPKHQLNVHGRSSKNVFTCDLCGVQCVDRTSIWRHVKVTLEEFQNFAQKCSSTFGPFEAQKIFRELPFLEFL